MAFHILECHLLALSSGLTCENTKNARKMQFFRTGEKLFCNHLLKIFLDMAEKFLCSASFFMFSLYFCVHKSSCSDTSWNWNPLLSSYKTCIVRTEAGPISSYLAITFLIISFFFPRNCPLGMLQFSCGLCKLDSLDYISLGKNYYFPQPYSEF